MTTTSHEDPAELAGAWIAQGLMIAAVVAPISGALLGMIATAVIGSRLAPEHANGVGTLTAIVGGTLVAAGLVVFLARRRTRPLRAPAAAAAIAVLGGCGSIGSVWANSMDPETSTMPWQALPAAEQSAEQAEQEPPSPEPRDPRPDDEPGTAAPPEAEPETGDEDTGDEREPDAADTDGWWQELPQPVGTCLRDFHDAPYLSTQAQEASLCVVDEAFFGGTTPTSDVTRNVTGELLFHATWATWTEADKDLYCGMVLRDGFDAAEDIGISLAQTWRDQIAAAGSDMFLDDYAMVLDVLDTCEERG
jgi:hypothetical protein